MDGIRLELLGPPRLRVGGRDVSVETRKAIGLLAYVVVEGPQDRATLDALLWPESDGQRARAALRRTLTALRRVLPDGALAEGDEVALAVDVDVDLAEVDRLLGAGHGPLDPRVHAEVDRLHRGEFLTGLWFRDAAPFEHWRRDTAEHLDRRRRRLLEAWCSAHVARREWRRAIEVAERRLATEPLHEPSHQQLMLLHAWCGDRAAATRQYAACVRILDEELGVAPLPRTVALDRAVRAGTVEPPPQDPAPAVAPVAVTPPGRATAPFVGRADELSRLRALHGRCTDGGAVAVVTGEAGIGKTRLVDELVATVAGPVVRVEARPGEATFAWAPITTTLRGMADHVRGLDDAVRRELARLAPDVAGAAAPAPVTSPAARTRLVDACATALLSAVDGAALPGLLVVDDLDQADTETRQLVAWIARRLEDHPVLVVVTGREAVTLPRVDEQLDLPRLDVEDVRDLAAARGGGADADRLHAESEGVPFLVVAYLDAQADGAGDWDLPRDARQLVRGRLERLGEVDRQVLAAAAVLAGAPDLDLLGRVSGRADEELVDAVEALAAAGLLALAEDGTCRLTHDKVRTVVVDETSPIRRRLLHRRAAAALARATPPVAAATLALHLEAAGDQEAAAAAHAAAGRHALGLYANATAIEHLETALALHHEDAADLLLTLGDLHVRTGAYGRAADRYTRAAARGAPDHAVEERLGALALRRGDDDVARAHLALALEAGPTATDRVRVLGELARVHARQDDLATAAVRAAEAVALADGTEVPAPVRAGAHNVAGMVARRRGEADLARAHLDTSLAWAASHEQRAAALNNLALLLGEAGDLDGARAAAREALEAGRSTGDRHRQAALLNNLADLLHAAGRTPEALALQSEAAEHFAGVDDSPTSSPEIWRLVDW